MANRYPFPSSQSQQHVGMMRPGQPGIGMWPRHQQQPRQQLTEEQKQREYLKQQQKLRLMAASSHKQSVSADKLIENLLERKETFRPKPTQQVMASSRISAPQNQAIGRPGYPPHQQFMSGTMNQTSAGALPTSSEGYSKQVSQNVPGGFAGPAGEAVQLPIWLSPQSPGLPVLYRRVWTLVGQSAGLVDTALIFPLLLTSGLPTDVLGFIWGLANQRVAGQLTEQELYIMLALVALAQRGCTFNNLSILNLIPQAPVPNLNLANTSSTSKPDGSQVQAKMRREELNLQDVGLGTSTNTTTNIESSHEDVIDDFADFQSAICETATITREHDPSVDISAPSKESTSVPSVPATSLQSYSSSAVSESALTPKFPSVLVVGNNIHSRGIGSRLANHSLGAPKQTKTRHHKHHHHHHHRIHPQSNSNLVTAVEDEFSDFQQAKDVGSTGGVDVDVDDMFPKCSLKGPPSKTFLLKVSAIRTDIKLDSIQQPVESEELASTKEKQEEPVPATESEVEIPVIPKFNLESRGGVKKVSTVKDEGTKELMSVEEDKYSALRALSFINQDSTTVNIVPSADHTALSDDFGDFLSADLSVSDDAFADIASRDKSALTNNNLLDTDRDLFLHPGEPAVTQNVEFLVDDNWAAFESAPNSSNAPEKPSDIWTSSLESSKVEAVALENLDFSSNQDFSLNQSKTTTDKQSNTDVDFNGSWALEMSDNVETNTGLNFLGKIYNDDGTRRYDTKNDLLGLESEQNGAFGMKGDDYDDDFGDFIGPETWPEEGKYIAKDGLFDGHSVACVKDVASDSQSVSSLELPPLALSRHGSLPSLDLKIFPSTSEKVGGQQSWDTSPQGTEYQVREWCRCVQSCLSLIQSAAATFTAILSDEVLLEVLSVHEGKDYLYNLLEVFGVCQRVQNSSREVAADSKQLELLLVDVERTWTEMEPYYLKAEIAVDLESLGGVSEGSTEPATCGICLASVCEQVTEDESSTNTFQLEYGGHLYHAACANLWVNCVDCSLPALTTTNALL